MGTREDFIKARDQFRQELMETLKVKQGDKIPREVQSALVHALQPERKDQHTLCEVEVKGISFDTDSLKLALSARLKTARLVEDAAGVVQEFAADLPRSYYENVLEGVKVETDLNIASIRTDKNNNSAAADLKILVDLTSPDALQQIQNAWVHKKTAVEASMKRLTSSTSFDDGLSQISSSIPLLRDDHRYKQIARKFSAQADKIFDTGRVLVAR